VRENRAGRYGRPEEAGAYIAFLCSAHAGFITAQNLMIDGGQYPGRSKSAARRKAQDRSNGALSAMFVLGREQPAQA
jgi:NAD(P)-dependent dehydrogenase (short-subunit alcohol dehydrogenase family)